MAGTEWLDVLARRAALQPSRWELPGLTVRVETNAGDPIVARAGELIELRYRVSGDAERAAIHFTLLSDA